MKPLPQARPADALPAPAHGARRLRIEMGTWVAIEARAAHEDTVQRGMVAAFAVVAQLARTLHPTLPESDVARINAAACGQQVPVRPETLALLRIALRLHRLSAGFFDPCLPTAPGCLADLALLEGPQPQVAPGMPLQLDLGGIAKGFAVDGAVQALKDAGCSAGLVNAGGDLRVFGALAETILLRHASGRCRSVPLQEAALAVSARAAAGAPSGHRGYYVRRGAPATARDYAAVCASDATTADALTKCVLLCPDELSTHLLRQLGAENLS
jgi:thiamine biosynthesis lipoprotein